MNKLFAVFVSCMLVVASHAQDTKKVFGAQTLGWYGMDFTMAKMVGFGDESPTKMKDEYFKDWNNITIEMDLAKTFQKSSVWKDPNGIGKLNSARETADLKADEDAELTKEAIEERIKTMSTGSKKAGLGVMFVVQSFNKASGVATVNVVFFDIATREILWLKKMTGKAGGGDSKKAWSAALKDIFNQIEKKEYKAWKIEANY